MALVPSNDTFNDLLELTRNETQHVDTCVGLAGCNDQVCSRRRFGRRTASLLAVAAHYQFVLSASTVRAAVWWCATPVANGAKQIRTTVGAVQRVLRPVLAGQLYRVSPPQTVYLPLQSESRCRA